MSKSSSSIVLRGLWTSLKLSAAFVLLLGVGVACAGAVSGVEREMALLWLRKHFAVWSQGSGGEGSWSQGSLGRIASSSSPAIAEGQSTPDAGLRQASLQAGAAIGKDQACAVESIGALGLVEPSGRPYRIGAPSEGVIAVVSVGPGDIVAKGQVLFSMDRRAAASDLLLKQKSLALAMAQEQALTAQYRRKQEEVRAAEAALSAAKAVEADASHLVEMAERLKVGSALSSREQTQRRFAAKRAGAEVAEAAARRAQAVADMRALDPYRPGAKVLVARAKVAEARARVTAAKVQVERLTVRAPIDGRVLAVSVRPGERVERGAGAPVVLGAAGPAHLRVEFDALDLGRFSHSSRATALRRGDPKAEKIALRLIRLDPMVQAKSQFADALGEGLDRRVATALYSLPDQMVQRRRLRIGELLQVRIAAPCPEAVAAKIAMDGAGLRK